MALAIAASLPAESLRDYLPAASATKAARYLAAAEAASSLVESRRARLRRAQLEAEDSGLQAYAVASASRGLEGSWAASDGVLSSTEAKAVFSDARTRALSAAQSLFSDDAIASAEADRDSASASLSRLILASGIGPKSAAGLERYLSSGNSEARLFPDAAQVLALLRKAGPQGVREAAAAAAYRSPDSLASALLAARARILSLAPAADIPLERLAAELEVYEAWLAASPVASYPGDLAAASIAFSDSDRAALARAIRLFASLDSERSSRLVERMALGDGGGQSAAASARRLAEAWDRSSASARRELALLCGASESDMSAFGSSLAPAIAARPPAARADALGLMASLSALSSLIADADAGIRVSPSEPALAFLARPELSAVARSEARYATLYADASRRLDSLYAQAAERACSRLENSPSVAKAADLALGGPRSSLLVRSIDLVSPSESPGRRIAFFASASDEQGSSVSFPIRAEVAAEAYASAFAKAAGLGAASDSAFATLSRYRQCVVCAYAPESENDRLVVATFPRGEGPALLGSIDLELAMLGGWEP
jgi:hypothetical protein